jgi:hypothetical protein
LSAYSLLFETVDGALLAEEQSITIDRTTNSQAVSTVAKGYAGESPGAAMTEVTVESALPAGGFEFDAFKKMAALIPTNLYTIGPGGKQLKAQVFIISDTVRHGVNQPASYTFKARGTLSAWT